MNISVSNNNTSSKKKEDDEKLNAILKYTQDTFKRFDLDETEIFQICECVRYFVTNRRVLSMTEIHIKKHSSITQISLKNFAWNIAFQYNIGGDMTTSFVMATFAEWFANSTFDTVRKIYALLLDGIRLKLTKIYYQNTLSNLFCFLIIIIIGSCLYCQTIYINLLSD